MGLVVWLRLDGALPKTVKFSAVLFCKAMQILFLFSIFSDSIAWLRYLCWWNGCQREFSEFWASGECWLKCDPCLQNVRFFNVNVIEINIHPEALCNIGYLSETHLELKSDEVSFVHSLFCKYAIVLKFCTMHDILCSVQNYIMTGQLKRMLWTNEISWDLSLRWVSDEYPLLHSSLGFLVQIMALQNQTRN